MKFFSYDVFSDTDDHKTPLLKRKQAGWQQANTDFIDLAQFMVKIPKMDKDGEKYKRPFLSECSGKRHRERPYSPFVRIAISPSTKERKRENFKLFRVTDKSAQ